MDVHLWIECTLLTENNTPLNVPKIFWRTGLSSEDLKMELITHTSHSLNSTQSLYQIRLVPKFQLLVCCTNKAKIMNKKKVLRSCLVALYIYCVWLTMDHLMQERHPAFDIHMYGACVVDEFQKRNCRPSKTTEFIVS